jgi:hypothetical protein
MFPWNVEAVNVLSAPTSQYTLQGWPPLAMTTWNAVLPVRLWSILKTQTALGLFWASSVKVMVVNATPAAEVLQYTPGGSVNEAGGASAREPVQMLFATSAF